MQWLRPTLSDFLCSGKFLSCVSDYTFHKFLIFRATSGSRSRSRSAEQKKVKEKEEKRKKPEKPKPKARSRLELYLFSVPTFSETQYNLMFQNLHLKTEQIVSSSNTSHLTLLTRFFPLFFVVPLG